MTSTALSVRVQRRIARSREQLGPLGFAVGAGTTVLALLGAGYLVWSSLGAAEGGAATQRGEEKRKEGDTATRRNRPTLSLSLGPNFKRTHATSLASLKRLLQLTSPHFLIHLITPPPNGAREDDSTVLSVAELSDDLASIADFDARRTLEYSTETGRHAIGRALKCNAHVEVLLGAASNASDEKSAYSDDEVTRYQAEVTRLRKASGVLVFLLLPAAERKTQVGDAATPSRKDVDRLLAPFGAQPGVKVIDLRNAAGEAWQKGGERLAELAAGWR